MPMSVREIREWLDDLDDDTLVGIAEKDMALAVTGDPETFIECGMAEWSAAARLLNDPAFLARVFTLGATPLDIADFIDRHDLSDDELKAIAALEVGCELTIEDIPGVLRRVA